PLRRVAAATLGEPLAKAEAKTPAGEAPGPADEAAILAEEQKVLEKIRSEKEGDSAAAPVPAKAAPAPKPMARKEGKSSEADKHYQKGVELWNEGKVDEAIEEFRKTTKLNPSAAGAYYNLGLAYYRKGDVSKATAYAFKAGTIYLEDGNRQQALRMTIFIKELDPGSDYIERLREMIKAKAK
ncbi:MAG: tetratricopeptide repeat protein, partial [Lentisphaerae bacterium]|nr:tetratricopeptide repeat protein [Lentisphaerota bacterium]